MILLTAILGALVIGGLVRSGLELRLKYRYLLVGAILFGFELIALGLARGNLRERGLGVVGDIGSGHSRLADKQLVVFALILLFAVVTGLLILADRRRRKTRTRPPATRRTTLLWLISVLAVSALYFRLLYYFPIRRLHHAVIRGDSATVDRIIDSHPDLVRRTFYLPLFPRRPLTRAVMYAHPEVVAVLLKHGDDPNTMDVAALNESPLRLASRGGKTEIVRLLLEAGADPNLSRCAALYSAVGADRLDVVELLLEHGAACEDRTPSPLDAAIRAGHTRIVERLLAHRRSRLSELPDLASPLSEAVATFDPQLVRLILSHAMEDDIDTDALSASLMMAVSAFPINGRDVRRQRLEILKILLDHGANVNAARTPHASPLHAAVGLCSVEIVRFLVEQGADVNHPDPEGLMPLDRLHDSNPDREAIERLLRDHGARRRGEAVTP